MKVEEAEKLFEIIEVYIAMHNAKSSSDGGLTESIQLSQLKDEFLDIIVENQ